MQWRSVPSPFEKRMVLYVKHHVQISGGPAVHPGLTQSAKADASLVFNTCRYLGFDGLLLKSRPSPLHLVQGSLTTDPAP